MVYEIEYLAKALKKARQDKNLSQRALSKKIGIPQSQISRIENAAVDLQTTSLLVIARALDMDVMLVPRSFVPAANNLIKQVVSRIEEKETQRPVYALDDEDNDG